MAIEITNQVRVQQHQNLWFSVNWYAVEDINLDVGGVGSEDCTISFLGFEKSNGDKHAQHVSMSKEEALALADAIYKLFKKD